MLRNHEILFQPGKCPTRRPVELLLITQACRTRPSLNVSDLGLNIQAFSHEERSLESLHTLLTQQIDKASSTPNQQSNAFVTGMRSLATLRDEWELEMMLRRKILQSVYRHRSCGYELHSCQLSIWLGDIADEEPD